MSTTDFEKDADSTLQALRASLDESGIDAEVELQMGILSVELPDGAKYIVNSHRAAQQIWMAAERTAWHFDRSSDGRWIAAKTGDELFAALEGVLSKKLGTKIDLARPA